MRAAIARVLAVACVGACGGSTPASEAPNEVIDAPSSEGDDEVAADESAPTCLEFAGRLEQCTREKFAKAAEDLGPAHEAEVAELLKVSLDQVEVLRDQCGGELSETDARYLASMQACVKLTCDEVLDCVKRVDAQHGAT
jgi:hypothetical protein